EDQCQNRDGSPSEACASAASRSSNEWQEEDSDEDGAGPCQGSQGTALTTFRNDDLVLQVRPDYDPARISLDSYEAFLDALCEDREYQKDAIRTTCKLLAGGEYPSAR